MYYFYNKNWILIKNIELKNNRFYINGDKISGTTQIKFVCSTCSKEEIRKKLYGFDFENPTCGKCKREKTNIEKYGVTNPSKSEEVKKKIGLKNSINNKKEEVQNKYKKTMMERYGVEHNSLSKELQEEKRIKCLEKYGVEHHSQVDEIRKKISESNKFENRDDGDKILKKRINTNIKRYNSLWGFSSEQIKEKIKNTNIKRYGEEWPNAFHHINFKKAMLDKYGVENPMKVKDTSLKMQQTQFKNFYNELIHSKRLQNLVEPLFDINVYNGSLNRYDWKCLECGTEFEDNIVNGKIPRCPMCFPQHAGISKMEKELVEWIKSFDIVVEENIKTIISPKEIDIYLPDYNLAIEFNGLYWHSDIYCDKNNHLDKTLKCESQGIQLIQIFEDEWLDKQDIVKARLKNLLGKNSRRIGARKTIIKEIDSKTKNIFLNTYHIQGDDKSSIKLGAYYQDELIGVMTFSKPRIFMGKKYKEGYWELSRFATISDTYTPGLASKLLKHFERGYKLKNIESFADRRWSQGSLYKQLGFEFSGETSPNYWYSKNQKRYHRYTFRKSELKKFENYHPDKTEKQIMDEAGYLRIYDCGNLKFIKSVL